MHRLLAIVRIVIGFFFAIGTTNAHAAAVSIIIDKQLPNPVQRTILEGDWWSVPPSMIEQFTMDSATIDGTLDGIRRVAYSDQMEGQACIFTVYGSWNAATGYGLVAKAVSVGVPGGPYIECSHSIDYSGSIPVVTFMLSGY